MIYETLQSGHSNSTQASGILNDKNLYTTDAESLEAQLDRLNYTLIGLLKPDEKEFCDSFSFQAGEVFDSEDDFIGKIDNFVIKHDRALMIAEDYRAHEMRKFETSEIVLRTVCKLHELYQAKDDIYRAVRMVEETIENQVQLHIGGINLVVNVMNDAVFKSKNLLSKGFVQEKPFENKYEAYIKQLENEIEDLKYKSVHESPLTELEKAMMSSYSESFSMKYFHNPVNNSNCFTHTQFSIELEYSVIILALRVLNSINYDEI